MRRTIRTENVNASRHLRVGHPDRPRTGRTAGPSHAEDYEEVKANAVASKAAKVRKDAGAIEGRQTSPAAKRHRVSIDESTSDGDGDDIVAQLQIEAARLWVTAADRELGRLDPGQAAGATGRMLLVVDDPVALQARAVAAGATELAPVGHAHGWQLGRIRDPFGHEWELGRPLGRWPPG